METRVYALDHAAPVRHTDATDINISKDRYRSTARRRKAEERLQNSEDETGGEEICRDDDLIHVVMSSIPGVSLRQVSASNCNTEANESGMGVQNDGRLRESEHAIHVD